MSTAVQHLDTHSYYSCVTYCFVTLSETLDLAGLYQS